MRPDEDEIDEDPQEEDLERLAHETAFCPKCGAEVWDQAEVCPECGEHIGGDTSSRPPLMIEWRNKWLILIVLALLVTILLVWVL